MRYHNITTADMMNGEGLRVVLWLSGCDHHCYNCQNPQTWDVNSGIPFDESAKEELFSELNKDYILGITFSGGDPLHEANLDGVLDLVTTVKENFPTKTIWLYTGYKFESIFFPLLINKIPSKEEEKRILIVKQCDVLVDGRYIDSQRNVQAWWRGSNNQKVIDIQKSLKEKNIILYCD